MEVHFGFPPLVALLKGEYKVKFTTDICQEFLEAEVGLDLEVRLTLTENPQPWPLVLPWATFVYNTLPGVLAPMNPHFFASGRSPPFISDFPSLPQTSNLMSSGVWAEELLELLQTVGEKFRKHHDSIRSRFLGRNLQITFQPHIRVRIKVMKNLAKKLLPV